MKYHIAFGCPTNLEKIAHESSQGQCPRHAMLLLQARLNAAIHQPETDYVQFTDRLNAKLIGTPATWAMARRLAKQLSKEDVVIATGEDIGIPLAVMFSQQRDRPRLAIITHNLNRPKARLFLKLWQIHKSVDLFLPFCTPQVDFLKQYLGIPALRVQKLPGHADQQFFTPGPPASLKTRPVIVSVGLEQRNYQVLAEATANLDVDVQISAFSRDAKAIGRAFPKVMPANMTHQFYAWRDLVQLYRDADLVVISTVDNQYAAGVTTLVEAIACRRPVIASASRGLTEYLPPGMIDSFIPGDADGLKQAIIRNLSDRQQAEAKAAQAHDFAMQHYSMERHVDTIVESLQAVGLTKSRQLLNASTDV